MKSPTLAPTFPPRARPFSPFAFPPRSLPPRRARGQLYALPRSLPGRHIPAPAAREWPERLGALLTLAALALGFTLAAWAIA